MERIAIIDHNEHQLYVEDVSDEELAKYNGDEEKYIEDNYDIENYSWDYVTELLYLQGSDVVELEIPTQDEFGQFVNEVEGVVS